MYFGTQATLPGNDAFVEIGGVTSIPPYGADATPIKIQTIGNSLELTEKGVNTLGGGTLECVRDTSDTGQTNLSNAQLTGAGNYNLRIIWNDKATTNGTGTIKDIKVKVLGDQTIMGGPNNPTKINFTLGYNSIPVTTAAT